MKHFLATTTAITLISTTGAFAQEITYANAGLSYQRLTLDDDSVNTTRFFGGVEGEFNSFTFLLDLDRSKFNADGFEADLGYSAVQIGYEIIDGLTVAVSGERIDQGDFDYSETGLAVEYDSGMFQVGAAVLRDDDDDSSNLFYAGYNIAPQGHVYIGVSSYSGSDDSEIIVGGDYISGPLDLEGFLIKDDDFSILDFQGYYAFGNDISSFGDFRGGLSLTRAGDDDYSVTAYELSAGYQISDAVWVDLGIGKFTGDVDEDISTISLKFEYEMGQRNLLVNQIREDRSDLLNSFALGL